MTFGGIDQQLDPIGTEQGDRPDLVVTGSFDARGDHLALAHLAAMWRHRVIEPVVVVTCGGGAADRLGLVRAGLAALGADAVPVLRGPGCGAHGALEHRGDVPVDVAGDGELLDRDVAGVRGVVLRGGAWAAQRAELDVRAVAIEETGRCAPLHQEGEALRGLAGVARLRDADGLSVLGMRVVMPDGFDRLHAPSAWGVVDSAAGFPRTWTLPPRSVRRRAGGPQPEGHAAVGAVLAALVDVQESRLGRSRRAPEQVALDVLRRHMSLR